MKILSLLLLMILSAPAAHAHEIKAGSLVIVHPTVDEAEKGQALARGSMEIRNEGQIADELLSIKAEFADEVTFETPGKVSVPANGRVLVPIAFHPSVGSCPRTRPIRGNCHCKGRYRKDRLLGPPACPLVERTFLDDLQSLRHTAQRLMRK